MLERQHFVNSLNNLGIYGNGRKLWLRIFNKDPTRAIRGIVSKIVVIRPISEVTLDAEEEKLIDIAGRGLDPTSWEYILQKNNYKWGDAIYDFELIHN